MEKYSIENVLDVKTNEVSESAKHRIGRTCYIYKDTVCVGKPLNAFYSEDRLLTTSPVRKIEEENNMLIVQTRNTIYTLKKISYEIIHEI